ncbi:MAG: T9SS type A sorting domain-containing protein [Bacteroidetes bacterium]|nr:T9SS type A sorting domain-containing protein [Bacteroidota bacterium]
MFRYLSFIGLFISTISLAQLPNDNLRDYCWIIGYGHTPPVTGKSLISFSNGIITYSAIYTGIDFQGTDASICDINGNLILYTNGMFVSDCTYTIMPHGDSLNPGYFYDNWSQFSPTYKLLQGALILPKPGSSQEYYIFHERLEPGITYPFVDFLYHTKVDMSLHNGLGDIYENEKNIPVINDSLEYGCISAVRHGNGRDWWVLIPQMHHGCYYRILLTPNGITNDGLQCIGMVRHENSLGQAVFSPDGTKYARFGKTISTLSMNSPNNLEVFSFDRCSGLMSNPVNLSFLDTNHMGGVAFSPNSRYLYYSNTFKIYQYDLLAADIASSKELVAVWDGFLDPVYNYFGVVLNLMHLGPDGKIYIQGGTSDYFSTIESPDSAGMACNVQQHSFPLPTFNNLSIPNYPNFRLYNWPNSLCDSLIYTGGVNSSQHPELMFEMFPNPSCDFVNIRIHGQNIASLLVEVYNILGEEIKETGISPNEGCAKINVSGFPSGLYFVVIRTSDKILYRHRFNVLSL